MRIIKAFLITCLIYTTIFAPFVLAKTVWTSKPVLGSQIDWSNPLSKGLVACFLMNEGGGKKLNDLSGKRINGNIVVAPWIPGKDGTCLDFSTTTNRIDFGDITALDGLTKMSWSFWIYGNSTLNGRIISKWGSSNETERCFLISSQGNNSNIQFAIQKSATFLINYTTNQLPLSIWTNVVVVWYGGNTVKIYFNGIDQSLTKPNTSSIDSLMNANTQLQFGYETVESVSSANMKLSNVQAYNRVLSPSEIQSLYAEPYQFIQPQTAWQMWKAEVAGAVRRIFVVE